jgi:hypothetical protein
MGALFQIANTCTRNSFSINIRMIQNQIEDQREVWLSAFKSNY